MMDLRWGIDITIIGNGFSMISGIVPVVIFSVKFIVLKSPSELFSWNLIVFVFDSSGPRTSNWVIELPFFDIIFTNASCGYIKWDFVSSIFKGVCELLISVISILSASSIKIQGGYLIKPLIG